ncbi:MAG: N-6 DNA methylase [Truepera sp.]|jgi:hypothetical protein|nr:N-6 DNA methylase [Truepera sp.]
MKDSAFATTIKTEGALLPADLLRRVQAGDRTLPALTPEAYHLPGGMRLNEAASRAWNALLGAWTTFQEARERLPEGDLGTTITRERWLLPLFQELNYGRLQARTAVEIDGKSYAVSHGYGHAPIHLVGCNVDLDRRTRGVAGAATASPHSLVQELLNRSDEHLWGVVTNGLRLRVLRDNKSLTRQAFLEFELEAMMEGEQYSDFVLLYLLLHQSRLESNKPEECVLEQWSREAAETGARALDGLRDGVERAITALGKGFLRGTNCELKRKLQEGELSPQDYYRQLLRLVYRLLFLFVAEDRDLLHAPGARTEARERYRHYSTQRLRELAAELRGSRHGDLYEALKVVMRALGSGGEPRLGLPELGGFLFAERALPELNDANLPNAYLLQAVRALAYTHTNGVRRPVDYKNLGSEELGSVYESLLELHPEVDASASDFELKSAAGNERKTTGSYYTPSSLISLLLDSALDPVVDEAVRGKDREDAERALLDLKVVDPAAGSGHFLIAAAQRIAKRLAAVRTGDDEPAPDEVRRALRDVIGNCIYGVDVNEMAAELCKVALWMEAMEPGKPLTFLEHHIRVGNSLFGTTRKLVAEGLPDNAFNPIEGDDKKYASGVKRRNREERGGQGALFDTAPSASATALATAFTELSNMPTDTPEQVQAKQAAYERLLEDERLSREQLAHDAWCAAFVWRKVEGAPLPVTTGTVRRVLQAGGLDEVRRREVERLATLYGFFAWELTFPEVFGGERSGFDVVLGNPPWERVKLQEKEWFAARDPAIANARNASERGRLIRALTQSDPSLHAAFLEDKRRAEGESHYARNSGRYPLTGRGDINTYPLFAELGRSVQSTRGRLGMVLPTGIATDDTTKYFFQNLIDERALVRIFDFENKRRIFPAVAPPQKFCLITLTGAGNPVTESELAFFMLSVEEVQDSEKRFVLTPEEIRLLNPNTGTCPVFRARRDANITKDIYRRVPVLVNELSGENPWGVSFMRMFDMANDSGYFRTLEELEAEGYALQGNRFAREGNEELLPLYEAKMFHQYNHRYGTFEGIPPEKRFGVKPQTQRITADSLCDPALAPLPRYWVERQEVERVVRHDWWKALVFRDIVNVNTNRRTAIFTALPRAAANHVVQFLIVEETQVPLAALLANLNSLVFDYVTRQKLGGSHLSYFIVRQLPALPPSSYGSHDLDFVIPRVLELSFTSWDLEGFAKAHGYGGPPFILNEERRLTILAELDAYFFLRYGLNKTEVEHVLDAFPILRRLDEEAYGRFRTKEATLEAFSALSDCGSDVSKFTSVLHPPPADASVTHCASTRPKFA